MFQFESESVSRSVVSNSLWLHGLYSLPDSVHVILQARILEWVAILFSRGFSRPRDETLVLNYRQIFLLSEPPGKLLPERGRLQFMELQRVRHDWVTSNSITSLNNHEASGYHIGKHSWRPWEMYGFSWTVL